MQTQVNIEFDQLVELVKQLPSKKWAQLKKEIEQKKKLIWNRILI